MSYAILRRDYIGNTLIAAPHVAGNGLELARAIDAMHHLVDSLGLHWRVNVERHARRTVLTYGNRKAVYAICPTRLVSSEVARGLQIRETPRPGWLNPDDDDAFHIALLLLSIADPETGDLRARLQDVADATGLADASRPVRTLIDHGHLERTGPGRYRVLQLADYYRLHAGTPARQTIGA